LIFLKRCHGRLGNGNNYRIGALENVVQIARNSPRVPGKSTYRVFSARVGDAYLMASSNKPAGKRSAD
jgi:hypothetical protein